MHHVRGRVTMAEIVGRANVQAGQASFSFDNATSEKCDGLLMAIKKKRGRDL
jgi:hypothetical protein